MISTECAPPEQKSNCAPLMLSNFQPLFFSTRSPFSLTHKLTSPSSLSPPPQLISFPARYLLAATSNHHKSQAQYLISKTTLASYLDGL